MTHQTTSAPATSRLERTRAAIQRGACWLSNPIAADGSIADASSINEYYKTAYGLIVAGHPAEGERVLKYMARRYVKDDGDLDGDGCAWFEEYRFYPHAWVLMAAALRSRFDLVRRIARFLGDAQDPTTGGFYRRMIDCRERGEQDMMTTGVVALALLHAGDIEAASRTAQWMERLFAAQPDVTRRLYTTWRHDSGLVTTFAPQRARDYCVDTAAPQQRYYQYGIPAAFLSALAGATGEERWLDLAQQYLHASRHCAGDRHQQPQSGKLGWGAAWHYHLTCQPADRQIFDAVADYLVESQRTDGAWAAPSNYGSDGKDDASPSFDLTGEFLAHLGWIQIAQQAG